MQALREGFRLLVSCVLGVTEQGDSSDVQETEAHHDSHASLLLCRDLKAGNYGERQCVRHNIREDVDGCIGEVEGVDIDTFLFILRDRNVVGRANGGALEDTGQDVASCLAEDNGHNKYGHLAQRPIP